MCLVEMDEKNESEGWKGKKEIEKLDYLIEMKKWKKDEKFKLK